MGCKSIWGGPGSAVQKSGKKRNTGSETKWRMSKHDARLAGAAAKRKISQKVSATCSEHLQHSGS